MCGRFDFHGDADAIAAAFGLNKPEATWPPRYNVAPTDASPVIFADKGGDLRLGQAHFGWRREFLPGGMVINARSETVHERPLFRAAFADKRCVVPAQGFYEWEKSGKQRLPWYFSSSVCPLFGLAGLYAPATGNHQAGFVILTTEPNEKVAPYHNRMPVMLMPQSARSYLQGTMQDAATLLQPFPASDLSAHRVSPKMNRAGEDGPFCIAPV